LICSLKFFKYRLKEMHYLNSFKIHQNHPRTLKFILDIGIILLILIGIVNLHTLINMNFNKLIFLDKALEPI
jgi:hypothetical protein